MGTPERISRKDAKAQSVRRLCCWSGGGMPGMDIHCGAWLALEDAGIVATAHAGTSAGSIIGAFAASGMSAPHCAAILQGLTDRDVRDERFAWKLRVLWIDSYLRHKPIEALLAKHLPKSFEDLQLPLTVFVTDDRFGSSCWFGSGNYLRETVLASTSISGVFPSVRLPCGVFSDGGTTQHLPLPIGWQGYDEVYLMVASRPLEYRNRGKSMFSRLRWNIDLLMEDQVSDVVRTVKAGGKRCVVIRPPLGGASGMLRFDHGLISQSYQWTRNYLGEISRKDAKTPRGNGSE